jgi:hypothetical protein
MRALSPTDKKQSNDRPYKDIHYCLDEQASVDAGLLHIPY